MPKGKRARSRRLKMIACSGSLADSTGHKFFLKMGLIFFLKSNIVLVRLDICV